MSGLNKVMLIGNVGKDPETRYLDNDVPVSSFTLATSETYRTKDGQKNTVTEWHNIVAWRGLAKIVEQYVKKGDPLYIEGKITNRSYEDKEGQKKYFTEIVAREMVMLGRKGQTGEQTGDYTSAEKSNTTTNTAPPVQQTNTTTNQQPDYSMDDAEDDLPF